MDAMHPKYADNINVLVDVTRGLFVRSPQPDDAPLTDHPHADFLGEVGGTPDWRGS
jgi:hypothetical protein